MSATDHRPGEPRLVSVAIPVALDGGFSYAVPEGMPTPEPGGRVVVPFGARVLVGVVRPVPAELPEGELRELLESIDTPGAPALSDDLVRLCEWIADYYLAPVGECYRLALPATAMGTDPRRVRLTQAGADALAASSSPLLARPTSDDASESRPALETHDRRLLVILHGAGAEPGAKPMAVAKLLTQIKKGEAIIRSPLARLTRLAEAELIELDAGAGASSKRARTELHLRRTDRLRGGSGSEPAIEAAVGRSKQRRGLLDYLEIQSPGTWTPISELRGPFPRVRQLLPPLIDAGLVVGEERLRELDPFAAMPTRDEPPSLSDEQTDALAGLRGRLDSRKFHGALLHGITGSGKTEVYLHLIAAVREQGGGAIVLVPEIALTPQLAERFRARFGDEVAVLHSGLTPQQRLDARGHILAGRRPIVIGARSAIFAPVPELRVIVIDEEHDASFKQDDGVRYNARDVALVRARSLDALVVLGSATPSLESWQGAHEGRLGLWSLKTRPTPRPLPEVEIVDLKQHLPDAETLLSARLRERLLSTVAAGEQAILFLNRRGFTTALGCKTCGSFQACPDCSASAMTYHLSRNRLMCHLCGHIEAAPQRCSSCGSSELEHGAAGTERVEIAIAADLPGIRVARLDRDTSRGKALLEVLDKFRKREADVLIGTQMLTKGHDFPGVTLVGVLRGDQGLALPDFRATERVFQLLMQVAGRAGRGDRPGQVLIQTWAPDRPAILHAKAHDYASFASEELDKRRKHDNPPIGYLTLIRISGEQRHRVDARAQAIADRARMLAERVTQGGGAHVEVLGPADSPIEKINRRLRMQILIRSAKRGALRWVLGHLRSELGARGHGRVATSARADVDPYSLM